MADDLDRAQQESDLVLSIQLQQRKPSLAATGYCHWCQSAVPTNSAHFCDVDCRDDFQQYRKKTNGGF